MDHNRAFINKMSADIKKAFMRIKPVCDVLIRCPTSDTIDKFVSHVFEMKQNEVQELQQYLLFPLITHIKSKHLQKKHEILWRLIDAVKAVLDRVKVGSFEMCMQIETGLLKLIFENANPGMIADVPEELKHSVMKCLTALMLSLESRTREKLLRTHMPLIAQAVFVSVHIAKLEKLRPLRLAAIHSVTAHTATHEALAEFQTPGSNLESSTVEVLSNILPGVMAALQDVATCPNNPGHAIVVAALTAIRQILCLTMNDRFIAKPNKITGQDFVKMLKTKTKHKPDKTDVSSKGKNPKDVARRTPEWFMMAGEKLTVVTRSLLVLGGHEHFKVRKELAVLFASLLKECNVTMQPSISLALDVVISLARDAHPEVSSYCSREVAAYFATATEEARMLAMDGISNNMFDLLAGMPRVLNTVDEVRKMAAFNLLHGYIVVLRGVERPQRLTSALSVHHNMDNLCNALMEAAAVSYDVGLLRRHENRDVMTPPPSGSPWLRLVHAGGGCTARLAAACGALGGAECGELVADRLLAAARRAPACHLVAVLSWMAHAPDSSPSLVKRVLSTYIEEDLWYLPLEVCSEDAPLTSEDTLDVTVYNPRAWEKKTVPGLYEGTTETRYTDISYRVARAPAAVYPSMCRTVGEAQRNMALCCALTEGVGLLARRLMDQYQPYLLKTLCLVLERVGSKYEMLHLAGLKAINDIAAACGHPSVAELIKCNADYFTSEITGRLKKPWRCQSALEILSVVMEYSDDTILTCLCGIVQHVLVQSCDKFHNTDLYAYLQVFLTFVECIRKWFLKDTPQPSPVKTNTKIDIMQDVTEYINNCEKAERLLNNSDFEKISGKSVEEMYREDLKKREDELLEYDDTVAPEKQPLPQHIEVTILVLKRSLNFITSRQRDEAILALQILNKGLPILAQHEDELLPLVHLVWSPLVTKFGTNDPPVMRRAFDLLVTMAVLSKDFIRSRTVKEVLPHVYKFLAKSSSESYLKDVGSWYRSGQVYGLQRAALGALRSLGPRLALPAASLRPAILCVQPYLSKNQPKPLQAEAVAFFKAILEYDHGAAWWHLRQLCDNDEELTPPSLNNIQLEPVVGTPYTPTNKDYETNIKLIFNNGHN